MKNKKVFPYNHFYWTFNAYLGCKKGLVLSYLLDRMIYYRKSGKGLPHISIDQLSHFVDLEPRTIKSYLKEFESLNLIKRYRSHRGPWAYSMCGIHKTMAIVQQLPQKKTLKWKKLVPSMRGVKMAPPQG